MADWEINRPLGQCCGSGKKIEPGEDYYGALVETEQGLQRRDFSGEYWEREKPPVYCFWKTKLAAPNEKKQLFVSDDMLMAFFERLAPETEAEKVSFRFVLALVLMRKRRLKYDSTKTDGGPRDLAPARGGGQGPGRGRQSPPRRGPDRDAHVPNRSNSAGRSMRAKSEIRNPKFETNPKFEAPKRWPDQDPFRISDFGSSCLFRASKFGFRISALWAVGLGILLVGGCATQPQQETGGLSGQGDGGGGPGRP